MAISFGPKLGLLYNALIDEQYFDSLRLFLQSIDQLINGSVINATQVTPPTSPSPGDAYLLIGGTPGGAWTGQAGNIAVWDAQLTTSGTNNVVPGWIFLVPKAGWIVWNVATASLSVFNGSAWTSIGSSGANFPVNTDITNMTALNGGTTPALIVNGSNSSGSITITGSGSQAAIFVTNGIQTSGWGCDGTFDCEGLNCAGLVIAGSLKSTSNVITNIIDAQAISGPVTIVGAGSSQSSVVIQGNGVANQQLLGFANMPTQTTVGAAGAASALPATPSGYMPIAVGSSVFVFPYYLPV